MMPDSWLADGCREIRAARAAGEHELAEALERFIREKTGIKAADKAERSRRRRFCRWCAEELPLMGRRLRFCSSSCQRAFETWEWMDSSWEQELAEARDRRIVEVMQREPEIETWALAERFGMSTGHIRKLRASAGLPPPATWTKGGRIGG